MLQYYITTFFLGACLGALVSGLLAVLRSQRLYRENVRLKESLLHLEHSKAEADGLRTENASLLSTLSEVRQESAVQQEKTHWIEKAEQHLKDAFQALSAKALQSNSEEHLRRTREQLDNMQQLLRGDWGKQKEQLNTLVSPLQERLKDLDQQVRSLEEKREGAYKGMEQHLSQLRTAYNELRDSTTGLNAALTSSSTSRGTWGEIELRRIVELAGLVNHVDFEQQETRQQGRPDMQIQLPNGGIIPVDAKTTLETYREVIQCSTDSDRKKRLLKHAQTVKNTIRELGKKEYWKQFEESPEFVVMFLPHDGILSAAFEGDGGLLEFAFAHRVLLVTPVTLLALLRTIAYGWQQQAVAENAQLIASQGRELYDRLLKFIDHFRNTGKALDSAVRSYNDAAGSLDRRLIPSARKFQETGVSSAPISAPETIDRQARLLPSQDTDTERLS